MFVLYRPGSPTAGCLHRQDQQPRSFQQRLCKGEGQQEQRCMFQAFTDTLQGQSEESGDSGQRRNAETA